MNHYSKTELGFKVLKDRSIVLNARQRQLLLLIGTDDLLTINPNIQTRLAQPEILNSLFELGLICHQNSKKHPHDNAQTKIIKDKLAIQEQPTSLECKVTDQWVITEHIEPLKELKNFHEIKMLMMSTLEDYCGLLAKPVIKKIESTDNFEALQTCRMQWITHLQESRIDPQQLKNYLQQINSSLAKLSHH